MKFALLLKYFMFSLVCRFLKLGYLSLDETPTSQVILETNPCISSAADGSDATFVDYILCNLLIITGELGDSTLKSYDDFKLKKKNLQFGPNFWNTMNLN